MKSIRARLLAGVSSLLLAGSLHAQTFPSKPVVLMVPYPVGGVSDVIARTLSSTLARQLGQGILASV